ncbi:MAG TPA: HD domain-containing protein [Gemmatimonadaceae bacterium]|nr:HD domain-containing protein [Gemmatimonadaceae bacterium]
MPILDLTQLVVGQRVQHELMVLDRAERKQATGDPFVVLTFGNATGRIDTAPIWSDKLSWADGAERGRVVQVIGDVGAYRGKRQIQLTSPLRIIPADQVRLDDFVARISENPERLWDWVDRTRAEMTSTTLQRVVDLFFRDDVFRERFERTPGSVVGHHAQVGGLLKHIVEVTAVAKSAARALQANADLVVTGALLHDIGKVEAYTIDRGAFAYTAQGNLIGHVVLGCLMLTDRVASTTATATGPVCTPEQLLELQHMILSHHGTMELGSPVRPMTTEAELVHWADEVSAKGNDMLESIADDAEFALGGEFSDRRPWRVGHRIWRRPHDWP